MVLTTKNYGVDLQYDVETGIGLRKTATPVAIGR